MIDSIAQPQNISKKTKQSIVWYTILPFTIHLIRFANTIVLARILAPSDFGIIGLLSIILFYCDSFSNFGFGAALIQRNEIGKRHLHSSFTFNFVVSFAFVILVQLSADHIAHFFNAPELQQALPIYSLLFIITSFAMIPMVTLKRSLNFKTLAIIDALKVCISIPISLTLALKGHGFWSIIVATLTTQVISTLMLLYKSRYVPSFQLHTFALKELLNFSFWSFVNGQIKLFGENIDKIIIGKFLGVTALGFYEKAIGLTKMPYDQIAIRIAKVSFSSLSRLQDQQQQLFSIFEKINRINAIVMPPIFIGLLWVSESFILVLLGEKWQNSIVTMQILALAFLLQSLSNPFISINFATNHIKQQSMIRGSLLTVLVISLLLTAHQGIEVVAINILIFSLLLLLGSIMLFISYMSAYFTNILQFYLKSAIPLSMMVLALLSADKLLNIESNSIYLLTHTLVGAVTYSAAILILPFKEFNFLKNKLLKKLREK